MSECAWVQLARVCQSVPSPSFPIIINDCLNGTIATPQVTTRSEGVCAWRSSKGARKRAKLNHWQPPFIRPSPTASGLTPMAYARSSPNILIYTPTSDFARPPTHQMMGYAVPPPLMHQKNGGTGTACSHRRTRHVAGHAAVEFE